MACKQPYCDYPVGQCAELCAGDYLESIMNPILRPAHHQRSKVFHSLMDKAKAQQSAQEAERIRTQERQSAIREIIEKMKACSITIDELNPGCRQSIRSIGELPLSGTN